MQLELSERKAKILAATPNRELHGEDPKPYCSLRLEVNLDPDDLAMFHPTLRAMLYTKNTKPTADLADQGKDATMLRFPQLHQPIKWNDECVGASLKIHYGTSEKSHIDLKGVVIAKPELEALEGGTIVLKFSAVCHPDEKQLGRLGMMIGTEIPVSVSPPEA